MCWKTQLASQPAIFQCSTGKLTSSQPILQPEIAIFRSAPCDAKRLLLIFQAATEPASAVIRAARRLGSGPHTHTALLLAGADGRLHVGIQTIYLRPSPKCCLSCLSRALPGYPSFYVAVGSRHVVMVSILSVGGYFVGANGGCQTPCLVISACTVAACTVAGGPKTTHNTRPLSDETLPRTV